MAAGTHIAPILGRSARANADQQQISRAPSRTELTVVARFRDGLSPENIAKSPLNIGNIMVRKAGIEPESGISQLF